MPDTKAVIPFGAVAASDPARSSISKRHSAEAAGSAEWRSRMMAATGHDLRQPLQVIALTLERLGAGLARQEDRQWVEAAFEQIERISRGLTDLAIASQRVDPAAGDPLIAPVSIAEVLGEVERSWRPVAEAKGLSLRVAPCTAWILSDRALLMTIINNLVGNAIKYTHHGDVLIGCRRVAGVLRIAVIDTGCGMAPDDLERIFLAFEQLDPSREGLGLGLWLVGSCCRALGHGLDVASSEQGSRFILTAPMALR